MADDDDKPPMSDFERMSLASLKRELASQQATSEQQRADAKERLAAEAEKAHAFPWRTLLAVLLGGAVLFVGVAFALQATMPAVADWVIPDFVYHPGDAGPPPEYPDAGPPGDAGMPDAGRAVIRRRRDASAQPGTEDLGLERTGGTADPLEGI